MNRANVYFFLSQHSKSRQTKRQTDGWVDGWMDMWTDRHVDGYLGYHPKPALKELRKPDMPVDHLN